jgi:cytochrome c oxidase subunit I+III
MPRRVYTYSAGLGWDDLNMISTIGAFMIAAGVLLFVIDLVRKFRMASEGNAGNVWNAGTLEWLPNGNYSNRSVPIVTSREPLWDQPGLAEAVEAGAHWLPNAPTGGRETLVTSPIEARPQYVLQMPGPGWSHVLAAVFTAACFLMLTVKWVTPALAAGALAVVCCLVWVWRLDPGPGKGPVEVGGGLRLPIYASGPQSHGWWAMVVLMLVGAALYLSYFFSYLYLWTVSPEVWAPAHAALPAPGWPLGNGALLLAGGCLWWLAGRSLPEPGGRPWIALALLLGGTLTLIAAAGVELWSHWAVGVRPAASSYGAMVFMGSALNGQVVAAISIMALFTAVRLATGRTDRVRRNVFDHTALLAWYAVGQGLLGLLLLHGFPRLVA